MPDLNPRISIEVQTQPLHYTFHIPGFLEIDILIIKYLIAYF